MSQGRRIEFDPYGTFYCLKNFTCAGVKFVQGGIFPWQKLGIDVRRCCQLWTTRYIDHQHPLTQEGIRPDDEDSQGDLKTVQAARAQYVEPHQDEPPIDARPSLIQTVSRVEQYGILATKTPSYVRVVNPDGSLYDQRAMPRKKALKLVSELNAKLNSVS